MWAWQVINLQPADCETSMTTAIFKSANIYKVLIISHQLIAKHYRLL